MLVGIALALFWDRINTVQELFRHVYCYEKDLKRAVYTQEFISVDNHVMYTEAESGDAILCHLSCFSCHPNLYCHDSWNRCRLFSHCRPRYYRHHCHFHQHPSSGPSSLKHFEKDPAVLTRNHCSRLEGRCRRVTVEAPWRDWLHDLLNCSDTSTYSKLLRPQDRNGIDKLVAIGARSDAMPRVP